MPDLNPNQSKGVFVVRGLLKSMLSSGDLTDAMLKELISAGKDYQLSEDYVRKLVTEVEANN